MKAKVHNPKANIGTTQIYHWTNFWISTNCFKIWKNWNQKYNYNQ